MQKLVGLPVASFFDIAANLSGFSRIFSKNNHQFFIPLDKQFRGVYYGKQVHDSDIDCVFQRAEEQGVDRLLLVGGHIDDSIESFELSKRSPKYYCTVGVHPCRANEVDSQGGQEKYIQRMEELIKSFGAKCVAIGECGLDYDRLEWSDRITQLKQFPFHFDLAQKFGLPMYLHNRNTNGEFINLLKENRKKFSTGVVHSYTDSLEEMIELVNLGLYIGVNGCSFKTKENIEVVKSIPLDRIMIETDAPYCEIRNSSAAAEYLKTKRTYKNKEKFKKGEMVRGRNEPCNIKQVSEVLAGLLGLPEEEITEIAYKNTLKMFNMKDDAEPLTKNDEEKKSD